MSSFSSTESLHIPGDRDPPKPGFFDILKCIMKACGMCCYVTCPPVPECVARKMAFHPPPKGLFYRIHLRNDMEKRITSAKQVGSEPFVIVPEPMSELKEEDYSFLLRNTTTFTVQTERGNVLVGVHSKPRRVSRDTRLLKQIIIFCQPNSTDLGSFLHPFIINIPHMAEMYDCEVVAFDYSGFGYSSGSASEENIYADLRAVYAHVRTEFPDRHIVLFGYSIGTSSVIDLASSRPDGLSGVVLVAPFTSGLRLLRDDPTHPKSCCLDRFLSVDKVSQIDVPTLICHGTMDQVIPHKHGMALYDKLSKPVPPLIVEGADHQTIFNGRYGVTIGRIYSFLRFETEIPGDAPVKSDEFTQLFSRMKDLSDQRCDWEKAAGGQKRRISSGPNEKEDSSPPGKSHSISPIFVPERRLESGRSRSCSVDSTQRSGYFSEQDDIVITVTMDKDLD